MSMWHRNGIVTFGQKNVKKNGSQFCLSTTLWKMKFSGLECSSTSNNSDIVKHVFI